MLAHASTGSTTAAAREINPAHCGPARTHARTQTPTKTRKGSGTGKAARRESRTEGGLMRHRPRAQPPLGRETNKAIIVGYMCVPAAPTRGGRGTS